MHERPFVLLPLADIQPDLAHPVLRSTVKELLSGLDLSAGVGNTTLSAAAAGAKGVEGQPGESAGAGGAEMVLPMGVCSNGHTRLWPMEGRRSRTYVMGIINATPDSFSDGGQHYRRWCETGLTCSTSAGSPQGKQGVCCRGQPRFPPRKRFLASCLS
ncbi:unnamed protein product [Ectocarpus sp. 12 AP-2014]